MWRTGEILAPPADKVAQFPLITASQRAHLSLGWRNVAPRRVALSQTGLTLEAEVTDAPNTARRTQHRTEGPSMSTNDTPLSDVRFLTVAEVASIMRVSKMTVYRLVHSGDLEAIRVGRSFRVPEQAVHRYLQDSFVAVDAVVT